MSEEDQAQVQGSSVAVGKKTSWPKIIGIIALLFGLLGAVKGGIAIATTLLGKMGAAADGASGMSAFYEKWSLFLYGGATGEIFLGGLLFVGGIILLFRKRFAMLALVAWALIKMLFVAVSFVLNFLMQREQLPLVIEQQKKMLDKAGGAGNEQMLEMVSGATNIISKVMMFVGLIWVMLLPLFVLIWFIRPKIRREMADWGKGA